MAMEYDKRKEQPREGPSVGSMNDSGNKGDKGDKVPELSEVTGPKIDRSEEQSKKENRELFQK